MNKHFTTITGGFYLVLGLLALGAFIEAFLTGKLQMRTDVHYMLLATMFFQAMICIGVGLSILKPNKQIIVKCMAGAAVCSSLTSCEYEEIRPEHEPLPMVFSTTPTEVATLPLGEYKALKRPWKGTMIFSLGHATFYNEHTTVSWELVFEDGVLYMANEHDSLMKYKIWFYDDGHYMLECQRIKREFYLVKN